MHTLLSVISQVSVPGPGLSISNTECLVTGGILTFLSADWPHLVLAHLLDGGVTLLQDHLPGLEPALLLLLGGALLPA